MPDGRLDTVEDFVFAVPEHQLAHIFSKNARGAYNEVQGGRYRGIQVGIAHQLPANFVDERQTHVEDNEVDVREVGGCSIHVPGLRMFDGLRAKRHAFMHADGLHAEFEGFFKYREGDSWIVHAPGEWLAVIVAHIVEFESLSSKLFDLSFHEVQGFLTLKWIDGAPEY